MNRFGVVLVFGSCTAPPPHSHNSGLKGANSNLPESKFLSITKHAYVKHRKNQNHLADLHQGMKKLQDGQRISENSADQGTKKHM